MITAADKAFHKILEKDIKTSVKQIIDDTKKEGIFSTPVVQQWLKEIKRNINNNKQIRIICYDYLLKTEGLYVVGTEVDKRYIKHKDRKQGWWD